MDASVEFDAESRYVVVTLTGQADPAALRALEDRLLRDPRLREDTAVVTDLTRLDFHGVDTKTMRAVARGRDDRLGPRTRVAVATQPVVYGLARAAQLAIDPDASRTRVVPTLDEAIAYVLAASTREGDS